MKENEQFKKLEDKIRSLPEPNYNKVFNKQAQDQIHEKVIEFSRNFDKNKKKRFEMNRFYAGFAGLATILLFSFIFLSTFNGDKNHTLSTPPNISFDVYEGRPLNIAVIGSAPSINETQIKFFEITFDQLIQEDLSDYDAIFVMEEKLIEAASFQFADIFLNIYIPTFFISAKSDIPFTYEDIEYTDSWKWSPGEAYAVGRLQSWNNPNTKIGWGYGLYNDKQSEKTIKDVYSRILDTIQEVDNKYVTVWQRPSDSEEFKVVNQIDDENIIRRLNNLLANAKWHNNNGSIETAPDYRIYHYNIWVTPYRDGLEIRSSDDGKSTMLEGEVAQELYKLITDHELVP
jgi:hypothetical protein